MDRANREVLAEAERIIAAASPADAAFFAEPDSAEARLYLQRALVGIAADVLDIDQAEAIANSLTLPTGDLYAWRTDRDGAVFVSCATRQHLYAPRGIEYAEHLASFQAGRRS